MGRAALQLSMAALPGGVPAGACRGAPLSVLLVQHWHQLSTTGMPRGTPAGLKGTSNIACCSLQAGKAAASDVRSCQGWRQQAPEEGKQEVATLPRLQQHQPSRLAAFTQKSHCYAAT